MKYHEDKQNCCTELNSSSHLTSQCRILMSSIGEAVKLNSAFIDCISEDRRMKSVVSLAARRGVKLNGPGSQNASLWHRPHNSGGWLLGVLCQVLHVTAVMFCENTSLLLREKCWCWYILMCKLWKLLRTTYVYVISGVPPVFTLQRLCLL